MSKIDFDDLMNSYPGNENLIQVYQEWGESEHLQKLFAALDRYEPDWNKEKELGSWSAEFLLDILQEDQWDSMTKEEIEARFDELIEEQYEDFRCGHQFARVNNINLSRKEGEDLQIILADSDEKIMFPKITE